MRVYGCEKRCADTVMFVLVIRYVGACAMIAVLFGEAKVNNIDEVGGLVSAHDEVCRFDIAMDEPICVNELSA